ncbi:MAG TPA: hypothetical protein VM802_05905 [Chitinophaga sp.]|uniref:hypothetical protein n=1 Tax=Chitinophaga sp. TaxID=1869181 RepID=UPI002D16E70F|nr:hypothetical protein [Chitinophaga sp.]HVI44379.1 hypothetical protein [Chitinophaga sp.]
MKAKLYAIRLFILSCLLVSLIPAVAQKSVQTKEDVIVMLNGEEKHGKITSVDENTIRFIHNGETLVYTLKKSDINKITFASGRVEVVNNPAATKPAGEELPPVQPNMVAILPFKYRDNDTRPDMVAVTKQKLQENTFTYLSKHGGMYKFQDPQTTNALLFRRGIDDNNIAGYTYGDLCRLLGVEYIVTGGVYRSSKEEINSQGGEERTSKDKGDGRSRESGTSSSNTTIEKKYVNEVTLGIYNQRNESIYSKQRTAFLNEETSYKDALYYMLKRCPIYNK